MSDARGLQTFVEVCRWATIFLHVLHFFLVSHSSSAIFVLLVLCCLFISSHHLQCVCISLAKTVDYYLANSWSDFSQVWCKSLVNSHLPLAREHPSYGDCLEVKREYYQNCSVLGCADTMFTVSSTLRPIWAVLTGPSDWVCHIGTLTLCIEAVA